MTWLHLKSASFLWTGLNESHSRARTWTKSSIATVSDNLPIVTEDTSSLRGNLRTPSSYIFSTVRRAMSSMGSLCWWASLRYSIWTWSASWMANECEFANVSSQEEYKFYFLKSLNRPQSAFLSLNALRTQQWFCSTYIQDMSQKRTSSRRWVYRTLEALISILMNPCMTRLTWSSGSW